eukprot:m.126852 g.126852  ORF g.126852 m.126852 type:complete len:332 (-) comp14530_c0_seq3:58-1053(-)
MRDLASRTSGTQRRPTRSITDKIQHCSLPPKTYKKRTLDTTKIASSKPEIQGDASPPKKQKKPQPQPQPQTPYQYPEPTAPTAPASAATQYSQSPYPSTSPATNTSASASGYNWDSHAQHGIQSQSLPQPQLQSQSHNNTKVLRHVVLSPDMVSRFLESASTNSHHNNETCGILLGSMGSDKLTISHLVLPKQKGGLIRHSNWGLSLRSSPEGPNSCDTLDDMAVFSFAEKNNLMTLGWIHTHPSQTAFLSSVDLHTQFGYQQMLQEAVAVVCSVKYQDSQSFRLTDQGMQTMRNCKQTGFHPHESNPPLFEQCQHVIYDRQSQFQVIDMR